MPSFFLNSLGRISFFVDQIDKQDEEKEVKKNTNIKIFSNQIFITRKYENFANKQIQIHIVMFWPLYFLLERFYSNNNQQLAILILI